jgi:hypothetical protein
LGKGCPGGGGSECDCCCAAGHQGGDSGPNCIYEPHFGIKLGAEDGRERRENGSEYRVIVVVA